MKVYLLSGGDKIKGIFSEEQKKMLKIDLKGKHNLVSIGAKKEYEKNDIYFYGNGETISIKDTFSFSDLDTFDLIDGRTSQDEGIKLLQNADIIYLQGGDPFVQLKYIKDNGYDLFLKSYRGIVLGVSAGTMNLGKIAFYSKDDDYPETFFYNALGLTNLTIDPHFDINDKDRVDDVIKNSMEHKVIGLPDYSVIVIDEKGNVKEFGNNYVFENGTLVK